MIRYILDTDHLSLLDRQHPQLKKYLTSIRPDEIMIDQSLRRQKLKIKTQDRRIAAIALASRCSLVTRNRTDFSQVAGLTLQDWTK
jgi:predicted nucleic acid-binding protein